MIAWVRIDNTNIHHPIMHGKDNMWYRTHDWQEQYSTAGSIFLDAENEVDFKDNFNILYGNIAHKTFDDRRLGLMFADVQNFANEPYFNECEDGVIFVPKGEYALHIVAYLDPNKFDYSVAELKDKDALESLEKVKKVAALYREPKYAVEKLVMLRTSKDAIVAVMHRVK